MYIARQAEIQLRKALESGKVVILTGARQVGKTTLVQHLLASKHVTMLNFDIPFDAARFKRVLFASMRQSDIPYQNDGNGSVGH